MVAGLGAWEALPRWCSRTIRHQARARTHRRLTEVFEAAKRIAFDDTSRIVFFGDCHRGNNGRTDAFAKNEGLFLHALGHYFRHGFTYVEVGDGDELWQNRRFSDVRRAHRHVFDLLNEFDLQSRLHLVVGNHDIQDCQRHRVDKGGLVAHEGLVLEHAKTGQQVFVVHGHQADFKSDRLCVISRRVVRAFKHLQRLGVGCNASLPHNIWKQCGIDRRIIDWVRSCRQTVVCGHTHRPACAMHGKPPYFNTGSCLVPGAITGLELQNGHIALVRWTGRPGRGRGQPLSAERELLVRPRQLGLFSELFPPRL